MSSAPKIDLIAEVTVAGKALMPALKRLTKSLPKLKPEDLPIGAVADLLYDLRQAGKVLATLQAPFSDVLDPAVKLLEEHFVQKLMVGESSGVQGKMARVQITESVVPNLEDPAKFYAFLKKTGDFELLNRALNRAAVNERWAARKQVPGVGKFHVKKVSCTRLGGR
jgi:hypothetical protein